ncbi:MAG: methyltransferase [Candidatus Thiodiazotropha sp.]
MDSLQRNGFKVKMFQRAMGFANALASLPNKMVPPPFRIIQIGSAYWQSRALYVATDLGIADVLGDDELSCDDIADRLKLHTDHLYRLLRMLASFGVFKECSERFFCNNELSSCLRIDSSKSVRNMVLLHNSTEMSRCWYEALGPALRTGQVPFVQKYQMGLFDYLDHQAEFDRLFTDAMTSVEALTGTDYLEDFDWSRFDRLIDVGGSNGSKAISILKRNPHMHALVFDRQQVIENAVADWRDKIDSELLDRLSFTGGDMLKAVPPARSESDIYLFVAVFHAMDDVQAEKILTNLSKACGAYRPTIAIIDCVAEDQNINPTVASLDMQMLIGTNGRERTETEWRRLFDRHDFALQEIVLLRTFAKLLVIKPS